jgi:hypothetical protein
LPTCRKCNEAKGDFDTLSTRIINPADIDPEGVFTYSDLRILPIKGTAEEEIAGKTIEVCNLNSPRLYNARSSLLKALTEYEDELGDNIKLINEADTDRKRKSRITKLKNSLEKFDKIMDSSSTYAGYCRWFVAKSEVYETARSFI